MKWLTICVLFTISLPAFKATANDVLVESFETDTPSGFPANWMQRFGSDGGHGEAVAESGVEGQNAFRNVGLPSWASEVLSISTYTAPKTGHYSLSFDLLLSSETNVPQGSCDDAILSYLGDDHSIRLGFERDPANPNGSYFIVDTDVVVEMDRWYSFHGVVNTDSETVDWYVDGVLLLDELPVQEGVSDSRQNRLSMHTGCIGSGQIVAYYDAIRFTGAVETCRSDVVVDGLVDVFDLLQVLADWGACP